MHVLTVAPEHSKRKHPSRNLRSVTVGARKIMCGDVIVIFMT